MQYRMTSDLIKCEFHAISINKSHNIDSLTVTNERKGIWQSSTAYDTPQQSLFAFELKYLTKLYTIDRYETHIDTGKQIDAWIRDFKAP